MRFLFKKNFGWYTGYFCVKSILMPRQKGPLATALDPIMGRLYAEHNQNADDETAFKDELVKFVDLLRACAKQVYRRDGLGDYEEEKLVTYVRNFLIKM